MGYDLCAEGSMHSEGEVGNQKGAEESEPQNYSGGRSIPVIVFLGNIPSSKGSRGTLVPGQMVEHKLKGSNKKMDKYT